MDSGWCLRGSEVPTIFNLWDSHGFPATNLNPFLLLVRHNLGNALASLGHGTAVWALKWAPTAENEGDSFDPSVNTCEYEFKYIYEYGRCITYIYIYRYMFYEHGICIDTYIYIYTRFVFSTQTYFIMHTVN